MATFQTQARSSGSSDSSSGSAYRLILDHIFTYPGSYEIPLRTMYTLNCAPRAQPLSRTATPASSNNSSPNIPQGGFPDDPTTQTFTENLMAQLAQLPNQPTSLPPSFITNFVHKCFPEELVQVDFPQALAGLDYLKDLETRRRREVAAVMARLDLGREAFDQGADSPASTLPGVMAWAAAMEGKERKINTLYTSLYIGLRRWIMINELSLLPFNKHNCVAMLNTLYPPVMQLPPTTKLTASVIRSQREGFFKYIQSVEKQGTRVLRNLMHQGAAVNDCNGWPSVTRTMSMYLQVANSMVNECQLIGDVNDLSPRQDRDSKSSRHSRKADSGISFGGSDRQQSARDSNSDAPSPIEFTRPKTPSGARPGTALEKLARGLMTIGRSRTDVTEMIQDDFATGPPTPEKPKALRKMKSLGSLSSRETSKSNLTGRQNSDSPAFDMDAMRQQRMKYEAGVAAQGKFWTRKASEV